jgi:hypothetical protein
MNPEVTDFIANIKLDWQQDICRRIRDIVLASMPDAVERLQYGKPHYLRNGKYAAVLGTAKGWVSFTIFNASALEAPDGFFEVSDSADRKTVKIRQGQAPDYDLLARLLDQAASSL